MARIWLPLGKASVLNGRQLGLSALPEAATAWVAEVRSESMMVRTWCEETTTHFEFMAMARAELTGGIAVTVERMQPSQLRLSVVVTLFGKQAGTETCTLVEHPRTGLQAPVIREVHASGPYDCARNPALTAASAEIFEYAPESALQTPCGNWLHGVLEQLHDFVVEGNLEQEDFPAQYSADVPAEVEPSFAEPPERQPPPERRPPSPPPREAASYATDDVAQGEEAPRLFATTNSGDSWEITGDETYIGRSKMCAVILKSQRVSRKHASVTLENGGWYLNDLGAANGVWSGSEKVEREEIHDGSEYIIGDVLLSFTVES